MAFKPVPTRIDYVQLEHEVQQWWDKHGVMEKYLKRNQHADKRWSFIDGPITANNPMGVHHAWGRSYKDLYNRFWTMRGYKLRYQNGFDCQGLWIEVEVEKEMGFKSKHDIERFGVAEFVEACKERVRRFAQIMTRQSIRLGYWMDWENSYYTNSDENNYSIWGFLKKCYDKGWLYKGKDTMPWCPRCGTGISQHEIVTEGYQEITHRSVYLKFPITGRVEDEQSAEQRSGDLQVATGGSAEGAAAASVLSEAEGPGGVPPHPLNSPAEQRDSDAQQPGPMPGESLLVWTTTPWTLAANIAAAVNPELTYVRVRQGEDVFYVSRGALAEAVRGQHEVLGEVKGSDLVGLTYSGPFDELPAQQVITAEGYAHRVIAWDDVSDEEGTGIVHIAPGAGAEDFALSKQYGLPIIAPLAEDGTYNLSPPTPGWAPYEAPDLRTTGFGFLEGRFAGDVPEDVFASLNEKGILYRVHDYTHRYPTCWRCGSELVFRLVDEWFISMDGARTATNAASEPEVVETAADADEAGNAQSDSLRDKTMSVTREARWIPEFGLARELDWLRNMHDWMISKKRYYGLALPIYECQACGKFEVIGSEVELQQRAIRGWDEFEGHSPHRPWVDAVVIACAGCGEEVERIKDVGNPWLDAGIVPYSTLNYRNDRVYWEEWFPADWVSESFPGQFRNWFYAMLAMSAAMEERPPFKALFGYALLRDETGDEMHKSKGNAIWFDDAAERMGADVMRWMFLRAQPANNLNFGWNGADELKRGFLSTLWNTYSFFVTYANIDGWTPSNRQSGKRAIGQSDPLAAGFNRRGRSELDRWALSELNQLVATCTNALENYDAMNACRQIEDFVEGLSNWYVRRSRRRFWKSESDADKQAAYETLWTCLATVNRLMAPLAPFMAEDMYQNLVGCTLPDAPESVHLTDWPVADESLIDRELSNSVRLVQRIVSLGRAARAKANIKVRQPLSAVYVKLQTAAEADALRSMTDQIIDELNVKALHVIEDESDFFDYQVRPNLPVVGPKYGNEVGRIQRALQQADKASLARDAAAGRPVTLDGIELQPGELLVSISGKPGYAVAEESGYAVAVATEITPELADEGLARELVRRIQEMRKSAGFEIAGRIRLSYSENADVERVLSAWRDYIAQETLAESIAAGGGAASAGYAEDHDIDGRKLTLTVEKV